MAVSRLAELTWEEARDLLAGSKTIAILPIGAIEAHGPHLPLATDVIIAETMARSGAEKLAARGYEVIILPTLAYTAAGFAAEFPGTVSLEPSTVAVTLVEIASGLAAHGLRTLAIANTHLDPAHLSALDAAAAAIREQGLLGLVYPDITGRPWAPRLGDEFMSGACHAGRYESSVVMAARSDLVREEIRRALDSNPASLSEAIQAGKRDFDEAGGPRAYFGHPAEASAEEGSRTIEILGSILEEAVLNAATG